eukprot:jgi/Botrbrau1/15913/Bobra.40_1s0095.1
MNQTSLGASSYGPETAPIPIPLRAGPPSTAAEAPEVLTPLGLLLNGLGGLENSTKRSDLQLLTNIGNRPWSMLGEFGTAFGLIANGSYAPAPAPCLPKEANKTSLGAADEKVGAAPGPRKAAPGSRGPPAQAPSSKARPHAPAPAPAHSGIPRAQLMSSFLAFVQNRAQVSDYATVQRLARLMREGSSSEDEESQPEEAAAATEEEESLSTSPLTLGEEDGMPELPTRATLSEIADDAAEDAGAEMGIHMGRPSRNDNKIHLTLNPASIAESAQAVVDSLRDQQPEISVEDTPETAPKEASAEGVEAAPKAAPKAKDTAAEAPSDSEALPEPIDILPSVTVEGETGPQPSGLGSRDVTLSLDPEEITQDVVTRALPINIHTDDDDSPEDAASAESDGSNNKARAPLASPAHAPTTGAKAKAQAPAPARKAPVPLVARRARMSNRGLPAPARGPAAAPTATQAEAQKPTESPALAASKAHAAEKAQKSEEAEQEAEAESDAEVSPKPTPKKAPKDTVRLTLDPNSFVEGVLEPLAQTRPIEIQGDEPTADSESAAASESDSLEEDADPSPAPKKPAPTTKKATPAPAPAPRNAVLYPAHGLVPAAAPVAAEEGEKDDTSSDTAARDESVGPDDEQPEKATPSMEASEEESASEPDSGPRIRLTLDPSSFYENVMSMIQAGMPARPPNFDLDSALPLENIFASARPRGAGSGGVLGSAFQTLRQSSFGRNVTAFFERLGFNEQVTPIVDSGFVGEMASAVLAAVQDPASQPSVRALARQGRSFLQGSSAFRYLEKTLNKAGVPVAHSLMSSPLILATRTSVDNLPTTQMQSGLDRLSQFLQGGARNMSGAGSRGLPSGMRQGALNALSSQAQALAVLGYWSMDNPAANVIQTLVARPRVNETIPTANITGSLLNNIEQARENFGNFTSNLRNSGPLPLPQNPLMPTNPVTTGTGSGPTNPPTSSPSPSSSSGAVAAAAPQPTSTVEREVPAAIAAAPGPQVTFLGIGSWPQWGSQNAERVLPASATGTLLTILRTWRTALAAGAGGSVNPGGSVTVNVSASASAPSVEQIAATIQSLLGPPRPQSNGAGATDAAAAGSSHGTPKAPAPAEALIASAEEAAGRHVEVRRGETPWDPNNLQKPVIIGTAARGNPVRSLSMQRSAPKKGGIPLDQFWRDEVLPLESPPKHNFKGRAFAASQNSVGAKAGEIPNLSTPTPLILDALSANSNYSRHLKSLWQGLDVHDEGGRIAPPDMGLCVGNGFILQAVNLVMAVWKNNTDDGSPVLPPITIPDFFNISARPGSKIGYSDPSCVYDASGSKRFYVGVIRYSMKPGDTFSDYLVAVSKTSDPTEGWLGPFVVRNDGLDAEGRQALPGLEICGTVVKINGSKYLPGCLGDYPVVGIDEYGLWSSFNMFYIDDSETSAGALLVGISKADLLSGAHVFPAYVAISKFDPIGASFTIAPSITQAGTPHVTSNFGTMYFVSTSPMVSTTPALPLLSTFAITGTSLLQNQGFPRLGVPEISDLILLDTMAYHDSLEGQSLAQPQGKPLDVGDGRTVNTILSGKYLWTASQSTMTVQSSTSAKTGAIWWAIEPRVSGTGQYTAKVVDTGYVGVAGANFARPALTANGNGNAYMVGFVVGPNLRMSAAFVPIYKGKGAAAVVVPEVSGRELKGGSGERGVLRAGDYSAAALDENGVAYVSTSWAATDQDPECIAFFNATYGPKRCPSWGTYIFSLKAPLK